MPKHLDRFRQQQSQLGTVRAELSTTTGLPVPWDASGRGRRSMQWRPFSGSVNSAVFGHVVTTRQKAHDQALKNPYAGQALDALVRNVVGTGIRPQPATPDERLNAQIEELWEDWIDDADADQIHDFYSLQAIIVRSTAESGEVFVRHRFRREEDGLLVPYQLQVIEAEHCPVDKSEDRAGQRNISGGIEFDQIGRRTAYWLTRYHPGDWRTNGEANEPHRVPASEVSHIFKPMRPGQIRGFPWLASILTRLYDLDHYQDYELARKKVSALISAFITSPEVDPTQTPLGPNVQDQPTWGQLRDAGVFEAHLEPGSVSHLYPGEEVTYTNPTEVGSSFEPFLKHYLRSISLPAGITYEQLTNDLSGVNFSSIRAGLIEARRGFEMLQASIMRHQFCRPVYRNFIRQAMLTGAIRVPRALRENERQLLRCKWLAPGWEYVDPVKERTGELMDLRAGTTSRSELVRQRGKNVRELEQEIAADNERADAEGLIFDGDPRYVAKSGAAHTTPPGEEPAEEPVPAQPGRRSNAA